MTTATIHRRQGAQAPRPLQPTGRRQLHRHGPFALTLLTLAAVVACGGDPKSDEPLPTVLSGTAAIGAPLAGATITVIDADASTADPAAVTAGSDGSYSIDISNLKAPILVRASGTLDGESVQHVAVLAALTANSTNTANVTPLTTAVATLVAPGGDAAALATPATLAAAATATNVGNASQLLVNTLASDPGTAALLGNNFNPMTTAFSANGTGIDAALERVSVTSSGGTVQIVNNAAAAGSSAPAPVTLTPAQIATPTVVPTLPPSVPAGDIPTAAELKALGDKFQACLALPLAQRVTLDAQGNATAVLGACNFAPADWRSSGRNFVEDVGQFTLAKTLFDNARLGTGQIVLTQAAQNLTDPKEFKHPYCNSGPCVVARWPMTMAGGVPTSTEWVLGKVNGQWNFVGNQRPYRVFVESRLQRRVNMNRNGAAAGNAADPYFFKDRYESVLRLIFDLSVNSAATADIRAVRFTGPGLPAAGVVHFRSQACGTDDRMGLAYQNGSTLTQTTTPVQQWWTTSAGTEFTLAAANLDGTPLATPVPQNTPTSATNQNFTPVALGDLRTAVPNWSQYKVEIFKYTSASTTPDEIIWFRIGVGPENASAGATVVWPALAGTLADDHITPTGAQAGQIDTFAGRSMSWTIAAGSYVTSGYLFGQNFVSATNSQAETATFGLRGRIDFEPTVFGNTTAPAYRFASPVAGTSMSTVTATNGSNPNPRCATAVLPPLTAAISDFRQFGLITRSPDRQLREAIWMWDN